MADATLDHLDYDALFLCHLEPSIFADRLSPHHGSPPTAGNFFNYNRSTPPPRLGHIRRSSSAGSQDLLQANKHQTHSNTPRISRLSAFLQEMENDDGQEALLNNQLNEQRTLNGRLLASVNNPDRASTNQLSSKGQAHRAGMVKGWFFTFIYYRFLFIFKKLFDILCNISCIVFLTAIMELFRLFTLLFCLLLSLSFSLQKQILNI